jgi:hypothetical protein
MLNDDVETPFKEITLSFYKLKTFKNVRNYSYINHKCFIGYTYQVPVPEAIVCQTVTDTYLGIRYPVHYLSLPPAQLSHLSVRNIELVL